MGQGSGIWNLESDGTGRQLDAIDSDSARQVRLRLRPGLGRYYRLSVTFSTGSNASMDHGHRQLGSSTFLASLDACQLSHPCRVDPRHPPLPSPPSALDRIDAEAEVDGVLLGRSAVAAPIPGGCDTTPSNRVDPLAQSEVHASNSGSRIFTMLRKTLAHAPSTPPPSKSVPPTRLPSILSICLPARPLHRCFYFAVCVGQTLPAHAHMLLRGSTRRESEIGGGSVQCDCGTHPHRYATGVVPSTTPSISSTSDLFALSSLFSPPSLNLPSIPPFG
ncbi:hypothetical protein C8F01DRAFT_1257514 [Mycena amicta]|nr:hypothetical protein C8F01DRAFT_1257514 [Mycena amicta]